MNVDLQADERLNGGYGVYAERERERERFYKKQRKGMDLSRKKWGGRVGIKMIFID